MAKLSIRIFSACTAFILCLNILSAQNGTIAGTIIDEGNGEALFSASVMVQSLDNVGTLSDFDGHYRIDDVPAGTYTLVFNYVGYGTKNITNVVVESGKVTNLDVTLAFSENILGPGVVVTAEARQENVNALTIFQKKSISIVDGISRDIIQRSPDKTTADALRRVSGTTMEDGKFVIIRGLSDRYNIALVNGNELPSTEPDRKTFAFDLFPSNLLDNLYIFKTAQPDLPGDFAGGVIQLNTRDIPDENFLSLTLGTGFNSIATFKPYTTYAGGKKDWLGFDDGTRAIPSSFPDFHTFESASSDEKIEFSKLFTDKWGVTQNSSAPLSQSYQLSGGYVKKLGTDSSGSEIGGILALTYNSSQVYSQITRSDFDLDLTPDYLYVDDSYKNIILWGGIGNISYKFNKNNRISLKNSYSVNASDRTTIRNGDNFRIGRYQYNEIYEFLSNRLTSNMITGDHLLPASKIKVKWSAGINNMIRDQPDLRTYFSGLNNPPLYEGDTVFQTSFPFSASPNYNGKFYSYLKEKSFTGALDITYPFMVKSSEQNLKVGGCYLSRDRQFDARVMGYVAESVLSYSNATFLDLLSASSDILFQPVNYAPDIIRLDETTNPSDSYHANVYNKAAYAMLDNRFGKKIRFVWGMRIEMFSQQLQSFLSSASTTPEPLNIDNAEVDILPSANFIYSLTKDGNSNIRLAASKTVTRPEIRELSPFAYYDYETSSSVVGNPDLLSTDIYNYDARFEHFFGKGQIISASLFYKQFKNPIEKKVFIGGEYKQINPINEATATNFGAEMELRKNFGFIAQKKLLQNLTFNANLAYIKSKVDVIDSAYVGVASRPLQGQSPYVINLGLSYLTDKGMAFTFLYNEIGRRIDLLGYINYPDIYENPRPQLDAQIAVPFLKKGLVRLTASDLLARNQIFYQDLNKSGKYETDQDNTITSITYGTTISLSVSYKF